MLRNMGQKLAEPGFERQRRPYLQCDSLCGGLNSRYLETVKLTRLPTSSQNRRGSVLDRSCFAYNKVISERDNRQKAVRV